MGSKIKNLRLSDEVELAADTVTWSDVLDEDNMTTDSVNAVPTQQSTKAYVDTAVGNITHETEKASIVDADKILIFDSADSDSPKWITLATLKTALA